jgi:hypothetical protein
MISRLSGIKVNEIGEVIPHQKPRICSNFEAFLQKPAVTKGTKMLSKTT